MTSPVLPVLWIGCGAAVLVEGIASRRHREAVRRGRLAVAALFLAAGAAVNLFLVVHDPRSYAKFAEGSYLPFVRHTWASLVVPHTAAWITLLIAFELAVGLLVLFGGTWTRLGYVGAIGFHVALLTFGFGFFLWSLPMIGALTLLLLGERENFDEEAAWSRTNGALAARSLRIR